VLPPDEERRRANCGKFSTQVAVRHEHGAPHDVERSATQRITDDHRKLLAQLVERYAKAQALSEQPSTARDPGGSNKRQASKALWPCRRPLGRHEAAERMTDQVDLLETNRAEPPAKPHDKVRGAQSAP